LWTAALGSPVLALAVADVDDAARLCDYLDRRSPAAVCAVHAVPPDAGREVERDGEDALNLVRSRLAGVDVRLRRETGNPAPAVARAAATAGATEVVVGRGDTARALVGATDLPVTVV
jgi:hypothetical protein